MAVSPCSACQVLAGERKLIPGAEQEQQSRNSKRLNGACGFRTCNPALCGHRRRDAHFAELPLPPRGITPPRPLQLRCRHVRPATGSRYKPRDEKQSHRTHAQVPLRALLPRNPEWRPPPARPPRPPPVPPPRCAALGTPRNASEPHATRKARQKRGTNGISNKWGWRPIPSHIPNLLLLTAIVRHPSVSLRHGQGGRAKRFPGSGLP